MAKSLYEEITTGKTARKRKGWTPFRVVRWLVLVYLLYFAVGALAPFAVQPVVNASYQAAFDPAAFRQTGGTDRAALVLDNQDALDLRLQMIAQAEKSIILTSFDIRRSQSAYDIFAALLAASERGVDVKILWDGMSGMLHGSAPAFRALGARDNVEIRFYNQPNFLLPWTFNGRMHDKYLIVDGKYMVLGGRNTFDLFLGDYVPDAEKSHDNDVLIYNTADTLDHSVIGQVEGYFGRVWNQKETRPALESVPFWAKGAVAEAQAALASRPPYAYVPEALDYASMTTPVDHVELIHNPTGILSKEPTLWWELQQLMEGAEETVYLQTPYAVLNGPMYEGLSRLRVPAEIQLNSVAVGDNFVASSDYLVNKPKLLATGSTVWEWFGDYSSHGKAALIDDLAVVGSYNWDLRSTYVDTELMLVFHGAGFREQLEDHLRAMEADCLQALPEGYIAKADVAEKPYQDPKAWLYPVTKWVLQPFRFLI